MRTTVPWLILSHDSTSIRASVRGPSGKNESPSIEVSVCINRPRDKSWVDSKGESFSSLPPSSSMQPGTPPRPYMHPHSETSRCSFLFVVVI